MLHGAFAPFPQPSLASAPFDAVADVAEPAALGSVSDARRADRFRRRPGDDRRQRQRGGADRASAIHVYACNRSMRDRFFYDADGELLIVPQQGALRDRDRARRPRRRAGRDRADPARRPLPRRAARRRRAARGYVCENYGALLRLPELGPIGANGLANARDFLAPVAAYERA